MSITLYWFSVYPSPVSELFVITIFLGEQVTSFRIGTSFDNLFLITHFLAKTHT